MKRVLITGYEGFCGPYLAAILQKKGFEIAGTFHARHHHKPSFPLYRLDITDPHQVAAIVRQVKPTHLCHLAAQSNARLSWEKPEWTYQINLAGTLNLIHAILKYVPATRFLFTSSVQVYGKALHSGRPAEETSFLQPENPYAISKALAEFNCMQLSRSFGLDAVIVRANNLFGCSQTSDFVFADWCRQIAEAEAGRRAPAIHVGNLELQRDFLPVEDGMAAYALLLEKGKKGEIYNLSSGKSLPLKNYLGYLLHQTKIPFRVLVEKSRFRRKDPPVVRISSAKLRALGWKPAHKIKDHLQGVLHAWRQRIQK